MFHLFHCWLIWLPFGVDSQCFECMFSCPFSGGALPPTAMETAPTQAQAHQGRRLPNRFAPRSQAPPFSPVFRVRSILFRAFYGTHSRFYAPLTSRRRSALLQAAGIFVAAALIRTLFVVHEVSYPGQVWRYIESPSSLRPLSNTANLQECLVDFQAVPPLPGILGLGLCMCVFVGVSFSPSFSCSCISSPIRCSGGSRDPSLVTSGCSWSWPVRFPCFTHLCATLAALVILWQISLNGIRVGEASNPGPPALNSVQASDGVTVPLPLSQVEDFAVESDAPPSQLPDPSVVSGSGFSPAVAANPYVSVSPPPQPLLARPSRFCSFSRQGSAVRRLSSQARSARPAPRRSRSPPQVSALAPSGRSPGPPPSRSHARIFLSGPLLPGFRPSLSRMGDLGSIRPHVDGSACRRHPHGLASLAWFRHLRGLPAGSQSAVQRSLPLLFSGFFLLS